jgi:hypothetical protein
MRPTPPKEMGRKIYRCTKEARGHFKELGPRSLPKIPIRVESKATS